MTRVTEKDRPDPPPMHETTSPDPKNLQRAPGVSVIVPARNEADNLKVLVREIQSALSATAHEILIVDDGSDDHTADVLRDLKSDVAGLRHIRHEIPAGQSAAVRSGLLNARGDLILTIDGDGENDPAYFPAMIDKITEAGPGTALIAGQRLGRKASFSKRLASTLANRVRSAFLGDGVRDSGCGLKCLRRSVFLDLPYFDGWHRYLPALVLREGYGIDVIDVVDRQRRHGVSKYGIFDRALVGILDLCGVWWLRRRRRRVPTISEITLED